MIAKPVALQRVVKGTIDHLRKLLRVSYRHKLPLADAANEAKIDHLRQLDGIVGS
jgi:hypothetical protein